MDRRTPQPIERLAELEAEADRQDDRALSDALDHLQLLIRAELAILEAVGKRRSDKDGQRG